MPLLCLIRPPCPVTITQSTSTRFTRCPGTVSFIQFLGRLAFALQSCCAKKNVSFQFLLSCLTGYHIAELFNPGFHGTVSCQGCLLSRPFTWMPAVDLSEPGQENNYTHSWLRAHGKYCPLQIETTASFQTWTKRYLPVFLSQWCPRTLISRIYMDSDQKDLKTEQGFCTWTFIPTGLLLPTCISSKSGWDGPQA